MKVKTKTVLVLIVTLVIGIVIGSLGSGMMHEHFLKDRMRKARTPESFTKRFEELIKPGPDQQEEVREILTAHFEKFHGLSGEFRRQMKALHDSLKSDLKPLLTDEQMKRFDERVSRFRRFGRPHPDKRGKKPHGPGHDKPDEPEK